MSGYKTYITAAVAILGTVGSVLGGEMTWVQAAPLILTALMGAFIRHGVSTEA